MNNKYCVQISSTETGRSRTYYITPTKVDKVVKLILRPDFVPSNQESFATLESFL